MTMWLRGPLQPASLIMFLLVFSAVAGAATLDRDYQFGEDPGENGSAGRAVGVNLGGTLFTFDSFGTIGLGDLQDLEVVGNPTYASVSDRPGFGGGVGISFDGNGDYLVGANLNLPATSQASVGNDDDPIDPQLPGPNNYTNISDRYFQLWVKPNGASQGDTQSVVMDSNQHGVRIVNGNWSMRYNKTDFDSDVGVNFNQWSHVMVARPFGPGQGSFLFVDGNVAAVAVGGYDGAATEELVVGSNTGRDSNRNFTGGTDEFFHGLVDNLTMAIIGNNISDGGQDFGGFDVAVDNEFIALALDGVSPADVNRDGVVAGDGSGPIATDDVSAFIDGWLNRNVINGLQIGDLSSRERGDLNLDGLTNLSDWAILNAADPAAGAAAAHALGVPEPTALLHGLICFLALAVTRPFRSHAARFRYR